MTATPSDEDESGREPWEPTDEWIGVRIKNQWSERTFYSEGYRSGLAAGRAELQAKLSLAESKAQQYERDWYAAKSEFGTAMAGMRERTRAAEQKIAALVWQVEHDGCMASREGETTYECRGDAPCALCRNRAERDTLRRRLAALVDENTRLRHERDRYRAQALGLPEPDHD